MRHLTVNKFNAKANGFKGPQGYNSTKVWAKRKTKAINKKLKEEIDKELRWLEKGKPRFKVWPFEGKHHNEWLNTVPTSFLQEVVDYGHDNMHLCYASYELNRREELNRKYQEELKNA